MKKLFLDSKYSSKMRMSTKKVVRVFPSSTINEIPDTVVNPFWNFDRLAHCCFTHVFDFKLDGIRCFLTFDLESTSVILI